MNMLSTVVAALYSGSDVRSHIRIARASQIVSCLRRNTSVGSEITWFEVIEALRKDNFPREAQFLSDDANFDLAHQLVESGKIITVGCDSYPKTLITSMGVNAPPILWISNPDMQKSPPWTNENGTPKICVSGVGCRVPLSIGMVIAKEVGLWTAQNNFLAISGGAQGCDTAFGNSAFSAGGKVVHILPYGLHNMPLDLWGDAVSVCPPTEKFSSGRAMERNNLIYSFAHMTVVCSARYRQGGSWLGASNAIKDHKPVVFADWTSIGAAAEMESHTQGTYGLAQRALANLGCRAMKLDIQTFRADLPAALDASLQWSLDLVAGNINSGLFEAS